MKTLHVSLLGLVCSLGCSLMAAEEFTVFAPGQDPAAVAALAETLSAGKAGVVTVVKTADEALKSGAEVLVLSMDRQGASSFGRETLSELKKKKVIAIGYGAAEVLGLLGLEINAGACAHGPTEPKPQIAWQKNPLLPESPDGPMTVFELKEGTDKPERKRTQYNFAMHLPAKAAKAKFVEALARWPGLKNHAPIVRQGNYLMVGLAAPATLWTPEYKANFHIMADRFAKAPRVAFAKAEYETTRPGTYELELAKGNSTTALSGEEFRFRFDKPVRFSAALEHTGSGSMMLFFMGPRREHANREDAKKGEPLRIQADISADDVKKVGDNYWLLEVANFDSKNPAKCKVTIEYPPIP